MTLNTKTGLIVGGVLIKDAQVRELSTGRQKLSFPLRYGWEEPAEPGARHGPGKLLDVDIWDGIGALDGMLKKGDAVIAVADEVKSREYNGKTYHSISPDGLFVSAAATLRWMQQVVDITSAAVDELRAEMTEMRQQLEQAGGARMCLPGGPRLRLPNGAPSPAAVRSPQEIPAQQTPPVPSGGAQGEKAADTTKSLPSENAGSLAGHELYEGEQLGDYAPPWGVRGTIPAPNNAAAEPPISEAEDLPF